VNDQTLDYSRFFWQGDVVRLRPLRLDDADQIFAASLDSPSRQVLQLGVELPSSPELMRSSDEKWIGCKGADGATIFMIETIDGQLVGGGSLHSREEKNGIFSFGIVVHRPHRGNGYASDAIRILQRYGFWERRYLKCDSACVHTLAAAIALHRKLGFLEEGTRRRRWFFGGQSHDSIMFGMTREEFDALEKKRSAG